MSVSARESGARLREEVQRALARSAKETTRVWFEQTVGNCGRWRGNDSESCRLAVEQSCQARDGFGGEPAPAASVSGWGVAKYHAAFELMRSEYCDDKLAGMIMFEELVLPDPSAADHLFPSRAPPSRESDDADVRARRDVAGTSGDETTGRDSSGFDTDATEETSEDEKRDDDDDRAAASAAALAKEPAKEPRRNASIGLDRFPALRDAARVFWGTDGSRVEDWSTCDWMCSKVLAPYARAHPDSAAAARALLGWARDASAPPFARRAALVAFVGDVDGDDKASSPDARFGDGFVMELAGTCAAALGIAAHVERGDIPGTLSVFAETLGERDPGETSDPTTDPEAWVRIGARWMLSLCARAMERAAGERARDDRARTEATREKKNASNVEKKGDSGARTAEMSAGDESPPASARSTPTKRPRSTRKRPRAAQA